MKQYTFKTCYECKTFYASSLLKAKEMAFNYFKTNLIDLEC